MTRVIVLLTALAAACSTPDEDGDGFADTDDCAPTDAAVNPGAVEVCNGLDDDCDGTIDGAAAEDKGVWYRDCDGDGLGDAETVIKACDEPLGWVSNPDDDDDTSNPRPGCVP
jgi:Protein metal binding site.